MKRGKNINIRKKTEDLNILDSLKGSKIDKVSVVGFSGFPLKLPFSIEITMEDGKILRIDAGADEERIPEGFLHCFLFEKDGKLVS